jgi:hypothetical protein
MHLRQPRTALPHQIREVFASVGYARNADQADGRQEPVDTLANRNTKDRHAEHLVHRRQFDR